MTKHKHCSRKTNRSVRMPATRFPHLRKRMEKALDRRPPKTQK